jgi:hypothetical protein
MTLYYEIEAPLCFMSELWFPLCYYKVIVVAFDVENEILLLMTLHKKARVLQL